MSASLSIEHSADPSGEECRLTGVLDFTTARSALQQIGQLIEEHQQLSIDFSGVTHCNSAALALLIELRAKSRQSGRQLSFKAIPDGIMQLSKVCQVDQFLD